jgi:hypothetical protein
MSSAKLIVAYPQPADNDAFENCTRKSTSPWRSRSLREKPRSSRRRSSRRRRESRSFIVWRRSISGLAITLRLHRAFEPLASDTRRALLT